MQNSQQKSRIIFGWSEIIFHLILLGIIFSVLILLTYPVLLNADTEFSGDEAFHFRQILEFLDGRLFFYYDGISYSGNLEGVSAIPFFWVFGVNSMAFKLSAILYYGLFTWSSYLLAKIFQPAAAWIWVLLLLFPPTIVTNHIITLNYCNSLTFFLINLTLINFFKLKMGSPHPIRNVSLLGFLSGLSIYVYAYSVVYLFSILILFILTHPQWGSIRSQLNLGAVKRSFKGLGARKAVFTRVLDIVIVCFFLAIGFAYIFGGFGLDVAGVTLLQINNLHKPVLQCLGLIIIRLAISPEGISLYWSKLCNLSRKTDPQLKKMIRNGLVGFLIGISPRLASILSGEVTRGGQGFDMDFLPTRMADHFFILFSKQVPESLDLRAPFLGLFFESPPYKVSGWYPALALFISGFIIYISYSYIKENKTAILKMVKFHQFDFHPELFFIIFPVVLFAALIVTMNGPGIHYLAPMHWVVTLFAAIYLAKLKDKSKFLFVIILMSWATFYTISNFKNYNVRGLMKGTEVVEEKENTLMEVIEFCQSQGINRVYTGYSEVGQIFILSKGAIISAERNQNVRGKRWKAQLASSTDFAILIRMTPTIEGQHISNETMGPTHEKRYLSFLHDSQIDYKIKQWDAYTLLWEFKGNSSALNVLRALPGD